MGNKAGFGIGGFVLLSVVMFIIPIPSVLLDVLLAVNLSLAMIVLFNAMFSKEALDMSSFPTILLFTTIFRISLNISSTRLILRTGDPGNVVRTFGQFVGGGDLIVGIIVFFILVLVQFIVINQGSERVAEVSARFTLDAMPGKQMAIDADLNTGALTDEQAKEKRQKIQDEASFFGSMDGASKYVKGDAIAGLIISVINFAGGIALGVLQRGMDINTALSTYSILTIGDGLVSQIPSLLISLATGVLVTKVSKEADLGDILVKQLFSIPRVLFLVGGAMIFFGVATPLSTVIFVPMGLAFLLSGWKMSKNLGEEEIEAEVVAEEEAAEEVRKPENVNSLLQVDSIELEFGYGNDKEADRHRARLRSSYNKA